MSLPLDHWYVATLSKKLKKKPISINFFGVPVVLYRDQAGQPVALLDRCPHKNVPLSLGTVRGSEIECRYHGWRFNPKGECTDLPCHGPLELKPRCTVKTYQVLEQDGWIWISSSSEKLPRPIFCDWQNPKYLWFDISYETNASLDLVLENAMDCAHTGFVHRGLFRGRPSQFVNVEVKCDGQTVVAETFGEKKSADNDVRKLVGSHEITHTDKYIYPATMQVDYWYGHSHNITYVMCTPAMKNKTQVYIRMGMNFGLRNWFYYPIIKALTHLVVRQDRKILQRQQENIDLFSGRDFYPCLADVAAYKLSHLYHKGPNQRKTRNSITFKL